MSKIDSAVTWAENIANDPAHGYDQINRWGPDYDCSSLVISAWQTGAGVPVKTNGATYTGNMRAAFLKSGFSDVTKNINFVTGDGIRRGDVLLNTARHTVLADGGGKVISASINEQGKATGGKSGDQTGREILIRDYYNYPWQYCLRYTAEDSGVEDLTAVARRVIRGEFGNGPARKKALTAAGYDYSTVQSEVNKLLKAESETAKYYVVQTGDTLTKIAKNYDTTVKAIKALNETITDVNKIYAGQKIRVK